MSDTSLLCSICIATHHRPKGLKRLLDSLLTQALPQGVAAELVVVDNDPAGSAAPVLEQYRQARFPLRTAVEPEPGVSAARNRCVQLAQGEYLAFIDDDEIACDNWLAALFDTLRRYQADGVFGRIITEFEDPNAAWMGEFHNADDATGDPVPLGYTGNCLIEAALLRTTPTPFPLQYGWGEQWALFGRLYREGQRMVYCHEAAVRHFCPVTRSTRTALIKNNCLSGSVIYRVWLEWAKHPRLLRIGLLGVVLVGIPLALIQALLHAGSQVKRWHYLLKAARYCGRFYVLIGRRVPESWWGSKANTY